MWKSGAASILCLTRLILADPSYAEDRLLQDGSYEIAFRLELPHLERWAVDKKTIACVSEGRATGALAPILSDNNPFAGCSAKNVRRDEDRLTLDIVCSGRDAAKAQASYTLSAAGFHARIAMTMGGKNMTMTEIQIGRRVGSCPPAKQD